MASLDYRYPQYDTTMCSYVLLVPRCGHGTMLLSSATDCPLIFQQLMRIYEPAAWTDDSINHIPFEVPDECCPHPGNIQVKHTDGCAGSIADRAQEIHRQS